MDDVLTRIWEHLGARIGGPLTFRLVLQPIMAILFAVRDGLKDAREGRSAYLWSVVTEPTHRGALLREAWKAVAKVFVIAIVIDAIYQYIALRWFYPGEALIVAFVLAVVPYVLIRGPVNRISRGWLRASSVRRS